MSKIIVTGGAGFIGSHLVDKLIEEDHEVIVIDNLSAGKKENINSKAVFYKKDICDFEEIKPLFNEVDYVFHLAAIPRIPFSIKNPIKTSKVNILGTINVFKAASENKIKRVVFASSSSVYGNQEKSPFKEDMIPSPISPYSLQKFVGEKFAELFTNLYDLPVICLRYFNVYGPRIDFNSDYALVIGKFLRQKEEKKPLTIYGNGEQTRGFCYVEDVVGANVKAMESNKLKGGEVINISSGKTQSINYLAKLIGGSVNYLPARKGDVLHTKADISLSCDILNWKPEISFQEGLKRTQSWFQKTNN